MMKVQDFVNKLVDIATNYKTLYVMGCFGAPMTVANKQRYTTNLQYNKNEPRYSMILGASEDTFGFDCVCLVKGVLWGWNGNTKAIYGGAKYASNGVPDLSTEAMIQFCKDVSTNFSSIEVGELLWMKGHVGVYIGDGLAVECTPSWENKVQITGLKGKTTATKHLRTWTKHGKLPWIEYNVKGDSVMATQPVNNELTIWKFLTEAIGNEYGAAGLMGNLQAESGLIPTNLENYYEKKFNLNDLAYTQGVDDGTYTNFVNDSAGYGLAQWTYWNRKQNLYQFAKRCGVSIGDLQMQLDFLITELTGSYRSVWGVLRTATSVKEASDVVLVQFERPTDQSEKTKSYRASLGQTFYDRYSSLEKIDISTVYTGQVTASVLNVRSGPGLNYPVVAGYTFGTKVTIYEEKNGWGKTQKGWISLEYVMKRG